MPFTVKNCIDVSTCHRATLLVKLHNRSLPAGVREISENLREKKLVPLDVKELMTARVKGVKLENVHINVRITCYHVMYPSQETRHYRESQKWVGFGNLCFPSW